MLMPAPAAIDGSAVVVSVTELALVKGVSKQAISARLQRWEAQGLIRTGTRRGKRNTVEKTVSLAEYDTVAGEVSDPSKIQGHATRAVMAAQAAGIDPPVPEITAPPAEDPASKTLYREQARRAGYDADLREMQLRKQRGELLEIEDVRSSMERCAEAIVRDVDQLPAFADDLAAAVASGGVPALREALKVKARELRERLARSMTLAMSGDEDDVEEPA